MIDEDNEFVYLVDEKLYLKDSGNIILQNVNHITFEVTAIDANEPPGLFSVCLYGQYRIINRILMIYWLSSIKKLLKLKIFKHF